MCPSSVDQPEIDESYVEKLREELERAREESRERHRKVSGMESAHAYSASVTTLIVNHMEEMVRRHNAGNLKNKICLVAIGGFGRRELVPQSDIDFCFITESEGDAEVEEFIKASLYPLWSLRLDLGYCVHTVRDALGALGEDLHKSTAFLGARYVWGEESLHEELTERFHSKLGKTHLLWFIETLDEETKSRHKRHGDTVFLLEPDLKNSCGGLRDIHQILWLAFAEYGESNLEVLADGGRISETEKKKLIDAWSFLIDLRTSMHLAEKRRIDKLTVERQIQVSQIMGLTASNAALAEETLMRHYYNHASIVNRLSQRLMINARRRTPGTMESLEALEKPKIIGRDFWTQGNAVWFEEHDFEEFHRDPLWPMRLFHIANHERKEISDRTLTFVEERLAFKDLDKFRASPLARWYFLSILQEPGKIAQTLRGMNRCGLLSMYIPEFGLVHNLPRIDYYHQYTVDEHLIRSVGVAESLQEEVPPPGMGHVAEVAKDLLRIDLLHLALLLHDVGKGEGRAHVIRGLHIAQRVSERMDMRPRERDIVRSLVANHQK